MNATSGYRNYIAGGDRGHNTEVTSPGTESTCVAGGGRRQDTEAAGVFGRLFVQPSYRSYIWEGKREKPNQMDIWRAFCPAQLQKLHIGRKGQEAGH